MIYMLLTCNFEISSCDFTTYDFSYDLHIFISYYFIIVSYDFIIVITPFSKERINSSRSISIFIISHTFIN